MNEINENESRNSRKQEFSLADIFRLILNKWYWFVISVVICLGAGTVYLKWTPEIYTRTATVLIKDDSGGTLSEASAFEELNMFNFKRNVENEILIFKSHKLMEDVAYKLHLDISYKVKRGLRNTELYTKAPVSVMLPEAGEVENFSFTVTPLNEKELEVSGFHIVSESREGELVEKTIRIALNEEAETPVGKMTLLPTLYYGESWYNTPVTVTKRSLKGVVNDYQGKLQVALANKASTIIYLTLQDESIPRAEDVLNTLISMYNADVISDKNQIAVNTSNFINERLIIIEKELGNVDSNIELYKQEQRLTDIISETDMYLQATSQYKKEGLALENQITLARYILDYLTEPEKNFLLIPGNTGISDTNIEKQIADYNELLLKREKLIGNSSSRNPVVMDLNNSLIAMRQSIIRAVENLITGLNMKLKNINEREEQTARRISAVPTQQKRVLSIERQQKIKEELYLYLLNKREENELSLAITESDARIIDAAFGSNAPVAPKSRLILLAAFMLGCLLPGCIIRFIRILDTKVHTRTEIEDATSVPFIGDIPEQKKKKGKKGSEVDVVVHENSRDAVSEAFRILRTNMEFMRVKPEEMKVIMFTSFNPKAGKSFISKNLAVSLALTEKKVILVDLDIRKETLNKQERHTVGVTNYLSGKISQPEELIKKGFLNTKLDFIPSGPIPPNPVELLLSARLETLISYLKEKYDYIVLDGVPVGMVADTMIVNRVADLSIFVVRAGVLDRRQLPLLDNLYREKRLKNMCVVLNGVRIDSVAYRCRYGYGVGYGYGYGE